MSSTVSKAKAQEQLCPLINAAYTSQTADALFKGQSCTSADLTQSSCCLKGLEELDQESKGNQEDSPEQKRFLLVSSTGPTSCPHIVKHFHQIHRLLIFLGVTRCACWLLHDWAELPLTWTKTVDEVCSRSNMSTNTYPSYHGGVFWMNILISF